MPAPKFIFTLIKATPALAISIALLPSHTYAIQSLTLAQADIGVNESPGAFEPPSNPGPDRGTVVTTTGTYFRPPSNPRPRSGSRTTTGTRQGGCLGDTETAFTIFGPDNVVGRTVSTHPEFVWYLPESETMFPVVFRLLAPNEAGIPTPIHTAELAYTPGFVTYQLPSDLPALTANQEYRWQVVVECNPNYPSRSLAQEQSFEVVSSPEDLPSAIATAATDAERAIAYGKEGLWYDAIAQVAQAATTDSQQARSGLLFDLAATTDNEQLSQDIAEIAAATAR